VQHNWNDIYSLYRYPLSVSPATTQGMVFAPSQARYDAVWAHQPQTVREAYKLASNAVLATVTDAQHIVVPAHGEPTGIDQVQNQRITLSIRETFKGTLSGTFTLFHTGTNDTSLNGDPAYAVGEQYILFTDAQRDDGRYVLVSPEGRYQVRDGRIYAASDKPAVARVNGISLDAFRALLRSS
jgi:hypothetical protein